MTRIDELDFRYPAALFRGDGSGIAVIARTAPVGSGPAWARVVEPGAGVDAVYVHLSSHAGDTVVYAVDGRAHTGPVGDPHLDPRLRSVGERFELADIDQARREDSAAGEKLGAARTAIDTSTFEVEGLHDGRRWSVSVGPPLHGETTLVLSDGRGNIRHLGTTAPRTALERARATPIRVEATEMVARPWLDPRPGRHARIVQLVLFPAGGDGVTP